MALSSLREQQYDWPEQEFSQAISKETSLPKGTLVLDCSGEGKMKISIFKEEKMNLPKSGMSGIAEILAGKENLPRGQYLLKKDESGEYGLYRSRKQWVQRNDLA